MKLRHSYRIHVSDGLQDRKNMSKEDFQQMLKGLDAFDSAKAFWRQFLHIKLPTQLGSKSKVFIFKNRIFPSWEDPKNKNGGRVNVKLPLNPDTDEIWQNTVLEFLCAYK